MYIKQLSERNMVGLTDTEIVCHSSVSFLARHLVEFQIVENVLVNSFILGNHVYNCDFVHFLPCGSLYLESHSEYIFGTLTPLSNLSFL